MPVKAGQIVIDISAGTGKFVQDMEVAKGKIREFGATGVSETKATRAAFKALEGDMFNNTRAAEQFAEKLLGVGNVAKYAFPVIGGLAFGGMIVEVGTKVRDFFRDIAEAPGKIANAFRGLTQPIRASNDELQISNDKLENEIAKLEHKPQNNLKLELDEARKSADDLAESLDKGFESLNKLLKEQNVGFWRKLFGDAPVDDISRELGDGGLFQGRVGKIKHEGNAAVHSATNTTDAGAARMAMNTRLVGEYGIELGKVNDLIKEAERRQKLHDSSPFAERDQSARLATLRGAAQQLQAEQDNIELRGTNDTLTRRKAGLTKEDDGGRKQMEETMLRLARELAEAKAAQADGIERINQEERNELANLYATNQLNQQSLAAVRDIYDTKRASESVKLMDEYAKKLQEAVKPMREAAEKAIFGDVNRQVEAGIKLLEEGARAATKWAEQINRITAQSDTESVRHRVAMAGIEGNPSDPLGTLAIQQAIQRADIQDRYEAKLKLETRDRERLILLRDKELELQKLQDEMEERTAAARHKNLADFMREMQGESKTIGDLLYDSAHSGLDRVSDQFSRLITGQKTSFGKMFEDIGQDMTKSAVKSAMQKGLGKLGDLFGIKPPQGKPDGTKSNPFHVVVDSQGNLPNPLEGLVPSLPSALGGSGGGFGAALKGIGGWLGGLFGGASSAGTAVTSAITFMAGGGDADPGHIYGVAEAGEAELISPKTSSRITPVSKLGGGNVTHNHYDIDARGSDLGAGNRVARALDVVHNTAAQNGVRASAERAQRTPKRN